MYNNNLLTSQDIEILKKIKHRDIHQIRNLKNTMVSNKERVDQLPRGANPFDLRSSSQKKFSWKVE